ncbi:TolC family protein [Aquifex sp.]
MVLILLFVLIGIAAAEEKGLEFFIKKALENNLELRAERNKVKSYECEYKSVRGMLFPTFKLSETYTKTDVPGYVLFGKLNQERITQFDFAPNKLNNPDSLDNYETKFSLEIPVWMGGKLRAFKNMSKYMWQAQKLNYLRKEEEVILKVYEAYANAVLAKESIKVAKQAVRDAEEHLRLAKKAYEVGTALFADVLRAKVYHAKALENLEKAKNNYEVAKKALELLINEELGEFDVKDFEGCESVEREKVINVALANREDYRATKYFIKSMEEGVRSAYADVLPQVFAFANYFMYDQNNPFGNQGESYMVGVGLSWAFNLGFSPIYKAKSFKEKRLSVTHQRELLKKAIFFEIDKAFKEYENALYSLRSAESRVKQAKEVVRVLQKRYENGMARMVDLLDAQTQLDMARLDYVKALRDCNVARAKVLFSGGILKEEVMR